MINVVIIIKHCCFYDNCNYYHLHHFTFCVISLFRSHSRPLSLFLSFFIFCGLKRRRQDRHAIRVIPTAIFLPIFGLLDARWLRLSGLFLFFSRARVRSFVRRGFCYRVNLNAFVVQINGNITPAERRGGRGLLRN